MNIQKISQVAIEQFVKEWKPNPYLWLYEIDIQRELAYRIKNALPATYQHVMARHRHDRTEDRQFSRVTCEPYVKPIPTLRAFHPDIVIWGDRNDDCQFINDGCWPIIWACEIKYVFQDQEFPDDHHRLEAILTRWSTSTAYQLIFVQDKTEHDDRTQEQNGRLTVYRIRSTA